MSADSGSAVSFDLERTLQRLSLQLQGIETVVLRQNETSAHKVRKGAIVEVAYCVDCCGNARDTANFS